MSVDPIAFRAVMGRFATGVTIVTTRDGGAASSDATGGWPIGDEPPDASPAGALPPGGAPPADGLGRPVGITVNALTSVSLDPPLVVVALDRRRTIIPPLRATGRFAVNILAEDQQHLSDCFAGAPVVPDRDAFCGATWRPGPGGVPVLAGTVAMLACDLEAVTSVGDHELFIGRVVALEVDESHPLPLLYYRRHYLRLERAAVGEPGGAPDDGGPDGTGR